MLSEPRTNALLIELLHLPMQHSPSRLRSLYQDLCTQCDFENFIRRPNGAVIERPASEEAGLARLTFSSDRIHFIEEGGLVTLNSFCQRLEAILARSMDVLGIPFFLMELCTVRMVTTPGHFDSASDFIGARLLSFGAAELAQLGRPTKVFGLVLSVPPGQDLRDSYSLRIEVFARDPKSLYLENVGTFRTPINRADIAAASSAMRATDTFVTERLCPFLSRFDAPAGDR
ncbi:MAG TPA: hypothetical protein PKX48_15675 [Planctomycetota bacterium]|jgi:hypothetical protein|nr:hypothetical protein [Planctomycetota bacterium]OQC21095.1 MAG: hypothetical protein BWX69_01291 [Planctomycetes bacterium ADurb.Bin069]HNS00735.1 hypothetical protein [Planctomycetota bacterium]HNU27295.1 hypothetical protein [Planctomycetota bacterium]HOE31490.1 hypothetical protein [Planctomycetota bacterium]